MRKLANPCAVQKCPANGDKPEGRGQRLHLALQGNLKRVPWCAEHRRELETWPRFGGRDD